ncbi:MAG TPA: nucleotide exchange factor GrpE [Clostridia bacterium]|nr:nucleotide exchange factor GrpE [Clostridia bacterium]
MKKGQKAKIKEEEIQAQIAQIEELTNCWKRALADYQNLEKRFAKEKEDFIAFANETLILKLLSVLDNLEKAQDYLKDPGLQMAIDEFRKILAEEELEEIKAEGKDFDPAEMEAIEVQKGESKAEVARVLEKGYRLKGKLLKPVKVMVNK